MQLEPVPQAGHDPPPQSVAVSLPFCTPSAQLAATQVLPRHTLEAQSDPCVHDEPLPHAGQAPPPQSIEVSVPLRTPSLQVPGLHTPSRQTPVAQSLGR